MRNLIQDMLFSFRMFGRSPGLTVVVVVTLALGIGANTAIFSVVNATLLQPLPFPQADRIVQIERVFPDFHTPSTSVPKFVFWRNSNTAFQFMTLYGGMAANLTGEGRPDRLAGYRVTAEFFSVFGVEPAAGRVFLEEEDRPGAPRVAVVSHGLWMRLFGGDLNAVGKQITLDGESYTVVGIMPPGFAYPDLQGRAELWVPMQLDPSSEDPANMYFATARLKDGVTLEEAQAEMRVVGKQFWISRGEPDNPQTATVRPLQDFLYGNFRPAFLILLGAVTLVLLVACANVANLMLARSESRSREIAMRTALGAPSSRIIRQFLTESLVLSAAGGLLALLFCSWSIGPLLSLAPFDFPAIAGVRIDGVILAFALGISLLTGLMTGIVPSLQAADVDVDLSHTLKEGSRRAGGRRGRATRMAMIAGEVALTLVIVVGATLLIQSFVRLRGMEPGFEPQNVLTMKLPLSESGYDRPASFERLQNRLLPAIDSLPGIRRSGLVTRLPLEMGIDLPFIIESGDRAGTEEGVGSGLYRVISRHFFETLEIPLLGGRGFVESDSTEAPGVAIINAAAARRYWPDEDPIGQQIIIGQPQFPEAKTLRTIVGVVGDVKEAGLDREAPVVLYVPLAQYSQLWIDRFVKLLPMSLLVKADLEQASLANAIQEQVWAYDANQPVTDLTTMDRIVARSIGPQEFNMALMSIFAALALLLAAVGIYGVLSYIVGQRTLEIGIRMALGAGKRDVLKMVLGEAAPLIGLGVVIGLAGALALNRVFSSLLFGVSATDPSTLVGVSLFLAAVALSASYLPARRAAKADPITALKYE